jgi:hypothetical protein
MQGAAVNRGYSMPFAPKPNQSEPAFLEEFHPDQQEIVGIEP